MSPGYFSVTINGEVRAYLKLTPGLDLCVHYSRRRKKLLKKALLLTKAKTLPTSIFVGYGYVQQASSGWPKGRRTRHHRYLVPEDRDVPDEIALAYGDSISLGPENIAVP